MKKLGRNDACWCGSGKKYKHCHEALDERLMAESDKGHIVPTRDLLKTPEQIEKIRESCAVNIAVLDYVAEHIGAGITTEEIDKWVYDETVKRGGIRRLWDMKDFRRVSAPLLMSRSAMEYHQRILC